MEALLGLLNLVFDFLSTQFVDLSVKIMVIITGGMWLAKGIVSLTPTEKDDIAVERVEEIIKKLFDDYPSELPNDISPEEKDAEIKRIAKNMTKK